MIPAGVAQPDLPSATPLVTMPSPFSPLVEAWAMLFQMMERLHGAVAKRELTLIDPEDPVASAAVSSILNDLAKRPSSENGQLKVRWIRFARGISAMHSAS